MLATFPDSFLSPSARLVSPTKHRSLLKLARAYPDSVEVALVRSAHLRAIKKLRRISAGAVRAGAGDSRHLRIELG